MPAGVSLNGMSAGRRSGAPRSAGGLDLLTGPTVGPALADAVAPLGGRLLSWTLRRVDHRPGGSTVVLFRAGVRWGGQERTEHLVAWLSTPRTDPAVDAPADLSQVQVSRFPQDLRLPGLGTAVDPERLGRVLAQLPTHPQLPSAGWRVQVRSYRPHRRAVVRVDGFGDPLFVKVLPPDRAAEVHRRHQLLREAGVPVPQPLGCTPDGLLVLAGLPGETMRQALRRPGAAPPSPTDLVALLDRLPAAVLSLPPRPAWADRAGYFADLLATALPAEATRVGQLAEQVTRASTRAQLAPEPTHGDFYDTQVLVGRRAVTGLLDVDTVGPGERVDDLACLLGHLDLLALLWPPHRLRLRRLVRSWYAEFARHVDPELLRHRVAGVLLSLATGPHRVREPDWAARTSDRLDLAERWLAQRPAALGGLGRG